MKRYWGRCFSGVTMGLALGLFFWLYVWMGQKTTITGEALRFAERVFLGASIVNGLVFILCAFKQGKKKPRLSHVLLKVCVGAVFFLLTLYALRRSGLPAKSTDIYFVYRNWLNFWYMLFIIFPN